MVEDGNSGEKNCWRKSLFLFCLREKSEASQKWSWVKWTQGRRIAEESHYFCFVCAKKVKFRKSDVEWKVKQSHGLLHRCPYYVSGPGNISVVLRSMDGQKTVRFHPKYLNLCSEDERRSYGFRTTWGRVINDRIFILGWTNLLTWWANQKTHHPLHQHIKGRPVRGLLYDGFSGCWRSRPLIVSRCRGTCRRERGHWLHVLSDLY